MVIRSAWQISASALLNCATALAILFSSAATFAQSPSTSDTVFEMPGVFRISLPPGWHSTKVIDDRLTVAVFSSDGRTLEVIHDTSKDSLEKYTQSLPDRRTRYEADDYPGLYMPIEVMENPPAFTIDTNKHFDFYTSVAGLPALWERNQLVYTMPPDQKFTTMVWSILTFSPGEYWSLELRGDRRHWSDDESDIQRMVNSFQLLEPTLSRAKAAVPSEAWKHHPTALPANSCDFIGLSTGIGTVVNCGWNVTGRLVKSDAQVGSDGLIASEQLAFMDLTLLTLNHYTGNWSLDDFLKREESSLSGDFKADKVNGRGMSYKRKEKKDILIDGIPAIRTWASAQDKKSHTEISVQLLTLSSGTDHFSVTLSYNPTYTQSDSNEFERIFTNVHLYPLRSDSTAAGQQPQHTSPDDDAAAAFGDLFGDSSKLNLESILKGCDTHPAHPPTADKLNTARQDVQLFNNSNSHLLLGTLLQASGDCDGSSSEFKTAAQTNPRNTDADQHVAKVYLPIVTEALLDTMAENGSFPTFIPATHDSVDHATAAWERVLAYSFAQNDADYAHSELASLYALKQNPLFALYHQALAQPTPSNIPIAKPDADKATQTMKNILSQPGASKDIVTKNPTVENRLHYAQVLISIGDYPDADMHCHIAYQIKPQDIGVLACMAQLSDTRGEQSAIISYANDWHALAPTDPEPYFWLARAFQWDPVDYKKVAENYKAVIDNSANSQLAPIKLLEARIYWPHAYENALMWQEAANAYEANVRATPNDAQALNNAAWFYATTTSKLLNPAKALDYAKRATAAAPTDPNIMDTLAQAYFVNKRTDLAISTEQKALALAPNRDDLQAQLKKFQDALKPAPKATSKTASKTPPKTAPVKKPPPPAK